MAAIDKAALLAKLKLAIGDLTPGKELDDYYTVTYFYGHFFTGIEGNCFN